MILFGGTFDPIHHGHLQAARSAAAELDRSIHMLIAPRPQLRPPCTASFADRWAMLQLACHPDRTLIPLDSEKNFPGSTYTITTLEHLHKTTGDHFVWIIGNDALMKVHLWHRGNELPEWLSFFVLRRPGFTNLEQPSGFLETSDVQELIRRPGLTYFSTRSMLDHSGSKIRRCRKQGKDFKSFVPGPVYDYIISKKLYLPKDSY